MGSPRQKRQFLVCIRNTGCEDLELRKLYERLPDKGATREGYVRIVDESGEDYLYPETYFVAVELPVRAERALAKRVPPKASGSPPQRTALTRRR
jgi:hypothetical protein